MLIVLVLGVSDDSEGDETTYTSFCARNPEKCDYSWDDSLPMLERFPQDLLIDIQYLEPAGNPKDFN